MKKQNRFPIWGLGWLFLVFTSLSQAQITGPCGVFIIGHANSAVQTGSMACWCDTNGDSQQDISEFNGQSHLGCNAAPAPCLWVPVVGGGKPKLCGVALARAKFQEAAFKCPTECRFVSRSEVINYSKLPPPEQCLVTVEVTCDPL